MGQALGGHMRRHRGETGTTTVVLADADDSGGATVPQPPEPMPDLNYPPLEDAGDGTWLAKLKSPPVDGKANTELIELVARHHGCARSAVSIRSGAGARAGGRRRRLGA